MCTANFYMPPERLRFRERTEEHNAWPAMRRSSADPEELDEEALLGDLIRLVEESELSIPRLAEFVGVSGVILSMWIAGTAKPQPNKLFEAKGLLLSHCANARSRRNAMGGDVDLLAEVS
jgi:hypothetical protein